MTTTIELPAVVSLSNPTDHSITFQPYHENFTVEVPAGKVVEFNVETAGQFFYYQLQAKNSELEFEQLPDLDPSDDTIVAIPLPTQVTLVNVTDHAVAFRPYRENFDVEMEAGDVIELEAKTVGQALYYNAQAQVNKGIEVEVALHEEEGPTEG